MIRNSFLIENNLQYENYPTAEDYKLWVEIAKRGGKFFIEPQNLVYYRISDTQFSKTRKQENHEYTIRIKRELLNYLIEKIYTSDTLQRLYKDVERLEKEKLILPEEVFSLFYNVIKKMASEKRYSLQPQKE
jgi:hypothetical protein